MIDAETLLEALKHIFTYLMQLGTYPTEIDIPTFSVVVVIVVIIAEVLVKLVNVRLVGTTASSVLSLVIYDAIVKGYSLTQVVSYVLFVLSITLTLVVGLARLLVTIMEHFLKYKAIFPKR